MEPAPLGAPRAPSIAGLPPEGRNIPGDRDPRPSSPFPPHPAVSAAPGPWRAPGPVPCRPPSPLSRLPGPALTWLRRRRLPPGPLRAPHGGAGPCRPLTARPCPAARPAPPARRASGEGGGGGHGTVLPGRGGPRAALAAGQGPSRELSASGLRCTAGRRRSHYGARGTGTALGG